MKKSEVVDAFVKSLNSEQWEMIEQLLGRTIAIDSRSNLISKLFKKTISISSRKGKARTLQKWVCEQVSKLTGIPTGKDEEIESREMGQGGVDVKLSKRVLEIFPFSIECKNQEQWSIPAWIEQAKNNQKPDTDWLLFITKNKHEEIVILDGQAFFKHMERKGE